MRTRSTTKQILRFLTVRLMAPSVALLLISTQALLCVPSAAIAKSNVTCSRGDLNDRLPMVVRFQILSEDQIEAQAWSQQNIASPKAKLSRMDLPGQEGVAIFSIAGLLGVSGDAKLLVTRTALKFHNVGSMIITNRTAGDVSSYHCR